MWAIISEASVANNGGILHQSYVLPLLAGFLSNNGTFDTRHSVSDISIIYRPSVTARLVVASSN